MAKGASMAGEVVGEADEAVAQGAPTADEAVAQGAYMPEETIGPSPGRTETGGGHAARRPWQTCQPGQASSGGGGGRPSI